MSESTVDKREFTFLWKIIGAYLFVLILNIVTKSYFPERSFTYSLIGTVILGLILVVLYIINLKPKFNQLLLLIVCISVTFASILFMTYDLPYKLWVAGVSIPLFLTLCGMWIYTKYSKIEVK